MSVLERIKNLEAKTHGKAKLKPAMTRICAIEKDVLAAKKEFVVQRDKFRRLIIVRFEDMSVPGLRERQKRH